MNLISTIFVVLTFLMFSLATHILICHLTSQAKFMLKGLITGFISTIAIFTYFVYIGQLNLIGTYLFLTSWLLYLVIMINLINSATLKMLAHLNNAPNGILNIDDFKISFNENGLRARLDPMFLNGFILQDDEVIRLTPKAKRLLSIIFLIRRIFSINHIG